MAKDLLIQWGEAVWGAKRPLLVLPASVDTDMFAAACALGHALDSAGSQVTILCPRAMSAHAQFLIGNLLVTKSLEETKTYRCVIPENIQVERVSHELLKEGGGTITLHLAHGTVNKGAENVPPLQIIPAVPAFDRIITLGAEDLAEVAPLFGESHHLLTQTPIATITWRPSSEAFGRWNVVYEQATTLSEAVASLLRETSPESVRDHVATCLLAGIIAKTKHFRSELVTPGMLNMSADLVAAGADRLKIIEELYRTRSVDSLKLWGAACARLQEIVPGVLFSELTEDDFLRTHTSSDALPDIAQEVLQSSDATQEIVFFSQEKGTLHAYIAAKKPLDARTFIGALRTEGTREAAHHTFKQETKVRDILLNIVASQKRSS